MTEPTVSVPIKRLDPTVELPSYAYAGDAGLDLRSNEDVTLAPHERRLVGTGLAVAIPTLIVYNGLQRKINVLSTQWKEAHGK